MNDLYEINYELIIKLKLKVQEKHFCDKLTFPYNTLS